MLEFADRRQLSAVLQADDQCVGQIVGRRRFQLRQLGEQPYVIAEVAQRLAHVVAGLRVAFQQIDEAVRPMLLRLGNCRCLFRGFGERIGGEPLQRPGEAMQGLGTGLGRCQPAVGVQFQRSGLFAEPGETESAG